MHGKEFETSYHYCPPEMVDMETVNGTRPGTWRHTDQSVGLVPLSGNLGSNNYSKDAKIVRQNFRDL